MNPGKKITKRHMKEDKLVSTAFKASEYIQNNKNYFISAAAVIIVVGFIIYFINYSIARKNIEAVDFFGRAQLAGAMQQSTLAINDYKNLLDEYGSTPSADRACYSLGKIYSEKGDCDSTIYYFNMYIEKYGKSKILLTAAYAGAASCYEELSDYANAGEYYFNAAELDNSDLYSPGYYTSAGRTFLKAELYDKAENSYQQILDKHKSSMNSSPARRKLAEIKYKKQMNADLSDVE